MENRQCDFLKLLMEDDLKFYEEFLLDLSDEEINRFFEENPDFMEEYHVNEERRKLLKDKMYRKVLKGIREKR